MGWARCFRLAIAGQAPRPIRHFDEEFRWYGLADSAVQKLTPAAGRAQK